jgi:hypothetical protein
MAYFEEPDVYNAPDEKLFFKKKTNMSAYRPVVRYFKDPTRS